MIRKMVRQVMTSVSGMVQARLENLEVVALLIVFAPFRADELWLQCLPPRLLPRDALSVP